MILISIFYFNIYTDKEDLIDMKENLKHNPILQLFHSFIKISIILFEYL